MFVPARMQGQAPTPPPSQAPAQDTTKPRTLTPQGIQPGQVPQNGPGSVTGPITLTLSDALLRGRTYGQQYLTAGIALQLAHEDRVQAKAALLPNLNLLNQYIYTQGNGTPSGVFVANDGVHVYNEQAILHAEFFSFAHRADYRRTIAAEAVARARQEVALRGLIPTLVQAYYGLITAQRHLANARTSLEEARRFLDITSKQERGGEAAHADVIKAQLQVQQRERDVSEADLAIEKAKVTLGVMLFADPGQEYSIEDDLAKVAALPALPEVQSVAMTHSPDLRAAQASLLQSESGIALARAAYYPTFALDYFFGIDANVFDVTGPYRRQNLGSVVQATVTVPVWNWGATRSKVRQAELQRQQSQIELQFTQRQLQANISTYYAEARTALAELDSLRSTSDLSAESLRLTLLRYEAGEATALEVSDAQTTLATARNAYDDGLARYRVALAALQTLTGTI